MSAPPTEGFSSALVAGAARVLAGPAFVVGGVFLLRGEAEGGDGFAAAVAIVLGLVLRDLAGDADLQHERVLRAGRRAAAAGLLGLTVALVGPALAGEPPLTTAPGGAPPKLGVLPISTATLFDLGVAVIVVGVATTILGSILRGSDR